MDNRNSTPQEIELKLSLPARSREALERFPALAAVRADRRREITRYFDTPDLSLWRAGFTLRVRATGNRHVQTLKQVEADPFRRGEWEWPVERDVPNVRLLADTPLASRGDAPRLALELMFVTDIARSTRHIELDGGTCIETAVDAGRIETDGAFQEISELELELKQGPLAPLYRFAVDLHEAVPMWIDPESKAARGYRLRTGEKPAARYASKTEIEAGLGGNEALRLIVMGTLVHILGNVAAADAMQPEGIHQFRVGLRRLRSAIVLFQPLLATDALALFENELKRLGQIFGARRDADVFCIETLPAAGRETASAWIEHLANHAAAHRDATAGPVREALRGPGLTGLVLGLAAWCEEGLLDPARPGSGRLGKQIAVLAPDLLDRMARKTEKRSRRIDEPADMHRFRKSLKKLRYGAEFLSGLYDKGDVKRFRKRCSALQDLLGDVNDARVTPRLAASLVDTPGPELAPAIAALAEWSASRERAALATLGKKLARFAETPPFWR